MGYSTFGMAVNMAAREIDKEFLPFHKLYIFFLNELMEEYNKQEK